MRVDNLIRLLPCSLKSMDNLVNYFTSVLGDVVSRLLVLTALMTTRTFDVHAFAFHGGSYPFILRVLYALDSSRRQV